MNTHTSNQTMPRTWILIALAFLLSLTPTCARVLVWGDAFLYIDFDTSTSSPFSLYSRGDLSSPTNIWTSFLPELGPYGGHVWKPGKIEYTLDIAKRGFDFESVDVKLGFAEVYLPLCIDKGRVMRISVNEKVRSLDVFEKVGCRTPHDLVFRNIAASSPIKIVIEGVVQNAMISNLVVRDSKRPQLPSTEPPPTASTPTKSPPTVSPSTSSPPIASPPIASPPTSSPSTSSPPIASPPTSSPPTSSPPTSSPPTSSPPTASPPTKSPPTNSPPLESFGAEISRSFGAFNKVLEIDAGDNGLSRRIPRTAVFRDGQALIEGTIRPNVLVAHRHGKRFTYHVKGQGTYDIQLSFAEINPIYCETAAKRVFSVSFNGKVELEALNVFKMEGCRRAFVYTRSRYSIGGNLYITFEGLRGNAMVSHILVRKARPSCTPESLADASTSDHLAHSVPGQYPPIRSPDSPMAYVDNNGDGFETVYINGDGSHTHFLDTDNNIAGRITTYEWTSPDTTEFVSAEQAFSMKFMLGTTRLSLWVQDNICSSHSAETSVTVTDSIKEGAYCYFYPGATTFPLPGGPDQEIKPTFAKSYPDAQFDFSDLPFSSEAFAARCEFFLSLAPTASRLRGFIRATAAQVSLLRGTEAVVDDVRSSAFDVPVSASMSSFEILYVRPRSRQPLTLTLTLNPELKASLSFDRSTVFPVITSLSPKSSSAVGAIVASVEVIGFSLDVAEVHFGNRVLPVSRRDFDSKEVFFNVPAANSSGEVNVFLKWNEGFASNPLLFTYFSGPAEDSIAFAEKVMIDASTNEPVKNELATSIRIGYGGDIYMGTLSARVLKLTYEPDTLRVTEKCRSPPLRDDRFSRNGTLAERSILGLVLDPRDTIPRPYVSTQTLFWQSRDRIDSTNPAAWRNGAIDRLKPGTDPNDRSICLVFDKRIVSGIPVSNHDHGVNGLEFTQSGDLIIAIGGNTNTGLPGRGLGSLLETPLSGSLILAKLSKGSTFDGKITYTDDLNPHKASVRSGDVELLATGIRNGFFPSLHSSGRLYINDNGPNAGFGDVLSSCDEIEDDFPFNSNGMPNLQGMIKIGAEGSENEYSVTKPDKVLTISMGGGSKFYGHPNPNRNQCTYVEPVNNIAPNMEPLPQNYVRPLMTISSSTNAIVEYHAGNVFSGALQGKLILSRYNNRATSYIRPFKDANEARGESPREIFPRGGLSLAVNAWGDMMIPRLNLNNILVLRPRVPNLELRDAVSVTAVSPLRHRRQGKTIATIGGYNFGPGEASVSIGGSSCLVLSQSMRTITCETPAAASPGRVENIVVTIEGRGRATLERGLWYMEV